VAAASTRSCTAIPTRRCQCSTRCASAPRESLPAHARRLRACPGGAVACGAGGASEQIVAVGANGQTELLALRQTGPRSESALAGTPVPVPTTRYIRIYPFIGQLPAIPGRFYPHEGVLCLYWHEPASNCVRLTGAGLRLLAPLTSLKPKKEPPTVPVRVSVRSHVLRYADGNIFAALELAAEERSARRRTAPADGIKLTVSWRGPAAAKRARRLILSPHGVYARGRLAPLPRGVWCYLAWNLPDAVTSAALIETTSRICR
jgi:hypothetical protein